MIPTEIENNVILQCLVGSTAHGLGVNNQDDRDEMGVYIGTPLSLLGLNYVEHHVERTQPEGVRSGPGDLDLTLYELKKWMRLALQGNPTIMLMLFAPVLQSTILGQELRNLASAIASKKAAPKFKGYMQQQRLRLNDQIGGRHVNRPELVEKFGFDTKYAGHILRLGFQGAEFLTTGALALPMVEEQRKLIVDVRTGTYTLEQTNVLIKDAEQLLDDAIEASVLPDSPDLDTVQQWMMYAYQFQWSWYEVDLAAVSKLVNKEVVFG